MPNCEVIDGVGFAWENFRKRPIVIQAVRVYHPIEIETLEGTMRADIGDWIIKGINGELYPCKPDIFKKTYEKVVDC